MKGLTDRQREIVEFIRAFLEEQKYPPTVREIADHFEISVKGSHDHIKALERKGVIEGTVGRSRAIRLTGQAGGADEQTVEVPIVGSVAAGTPLLAEENLEGRVAVPSCMLGRGGQHFGLHVRGDSMTNAGILDGDLAIIRHQQSAENGEIVVAMVDEAVTLKRLYVERNRARLESENDSYPPIYAQNVRILGRLACIIRRYG